MVRRILSAFGWKEFLGLLVNVAGVSVILGIIATFIGLNAGEVVYTAVVLLFPILIIRKVIQNRRGKKKQEEVSENEKE